jgi:hypothetical protein
MHPRRTWLRRLQLPLFIFGDQQQAIEFWTKQIGFKVLTTACSGLHFALPVMKSTHETSPAKSQRNVDGFTDESV